MSDVIQVTILQDERVAVILAGGVGQDGADGLVTSVVAGTNISVDDSDPANPIVSATGGGGVVDSVVAGSGVSVDSTDPANPVVTAVAGTGDVDTIVGGDNINVDSSDPANPVVSVTGVVLTVVAGDGITVDDTDPLNPVVAGAGVASVVAGSGITVDDTDPLNPVVAATGGGGSSEVFCEILVNPNGTPIDFYARAQPSTEVGATSNTIFVGVKQVAPLGTLFGSIIFNGAVGSSEPSVTISAGLIFVSADGTNGVQANLDNATFGAAPRTAAHDTTFTTNMGDFHNDSGAAFGTDLTYLGGTSGYQTTAGGLFLVYLTYALKVV